MINQRLKKWRDLFFLFSDQLFLFLFGPFQGFCADRSGFVSPFCRGWQRCAGGFRGKQKGEASSVGMGQKGVQANGQKRKKRFRVCSLLGR